MVGGVVVTESSAAASKPVPAFMTIRVDGHGRFELGTGCTSVAEECVDLRQSDHRLGDACDSIGLFLLQLNRSIEPVPGRLEFAGIEGEQSQTVEGVTFIRGQLQMPPEGLSGGCRITEVVVAPPEEVRRRWVRGLGVDGPREPLGAGGVSTLPVVGESEEKECSGIVAIGLHPLSNTDSGRAGLILLDEPECLGQLAIDDRDGLPGRVRCLLGRGGSFA